MRESRLKVGVVATWSCLALGSILRVLWPLDIEWKYDEKWMLERAIQIADGNSPWPWIGMPSGAGVENPGASIWPFALLAHIARTPISMTFAVMLLNVVALWGFALWVHKTWPAETRERGMWGIALFAVSPLPVLFARKIWAQDLLPVLLVPWLWAHTKREHFGAAFAWGLIGATLGQIHMSGFFAAAALALATLIVDRKGTRWLGWFLGSCVAALPLLPWIKFVASPAANHISAGYTVSVMFFWDALLNAFGLRLRYSLKHDFLTYLSGPQLFGTSTYLAGAAHVALLSMVFVGGWLAIRNRVWLKLPTDLQIHAISILGCGAMLHGLGVKFHPHYLIVFSPLLQMFVAWVFALRARLFWWTCGLQCFVTLTFMWFIHTNGGAPRGDYGVSYRAQTPEQRAPLSAK
ncbi:MAG TPA: hypothetical protein VFG30_19185 [Polyangiales bacterium]|nr:hypothetical protein [Polyangiales bacterium]